MDTEVTEALKEKVADNRKRKISFDTGKLAYPYICRYADKVKEKFTHIEVKGYEIRNDFFGERITVSGLLTGQDIINQLKEEKLGECLLLPCNLLRSGEDVFLDDKTVGDIETALKVSVQIVDETGADFVAAVLGEDTGKTNKRRTMYEQTDCSNCWKA